MYQMHQKTKRSSTGFISMIFFPFLFSPLETNYCTQAKRLGQSYYLSKAKNISAE